MSDSNPVVDIQGLSKHYGDFVALDNLTMQVNKGEILGFIGPNGAGKTTAIKILVGLSRPTSGDAYISGVHCSQQSHKIKHLVGYMPDKFGSYDNMRVREYLDFFAAVFGIHGKRRRQRIDEVMQISETAYMQDKFVEALSHGMQQRVGIARTLLHDPQVLILDEPANGLDPKARIEMRTLLLKLAAEGRTLIVTSHILPELARICDTIAMINGGKLRAFGSLDSVMQELCPVRSYEIQLVHESDLDRAAEVIASVNSAAESKHQIEKSVQERTIRFPTSSTETELSGVLGRLVQANVAVAQFREVASDLEDAFLQVANAQSSAEQTKKENAVSAT